MDMRDVARIAGVSSATVSRVINGSPRVRPETAEHVRRVIEELKFYPNTNAAALKWGKSGTMGVIVPDITNPFFAEFIMFLEKILVDHNKEMLMVTTQLELRHMQDVVRRMLVRRVDGVALLASEVETESIEALLLHRTPLVTLDRRRVGPGLSDIYNDYQPGIDEAVAYLKGLGHRRIAFIGGTAHLNTTDYRNQAFLTALQKYGLRIYDEYMKAGDYHIDGGIRAMQELLTLSQPPTAVMTANDLTAIGALRLIHERGLDVPRDISIIGFDDTEFCRILHPPLTSIRLSREDYAKTFFHALTEGCEAPDAIGKQYSVSTSLVVRSSSGPAPLPRHIHKGPTKSKD